LAAWPLYAQVFSIAAPVVVELILTSLTQMVDIIMVGKLGAHAISAVGVTNQPRFIMLASFVALNVGTTALVARFKGQGNKKDAELVTGQTVMLSISLAFLLSLLGILFAKPMVRVIGAGTDILDEASAYFRILMFGFIPTALPISISALLRGVGDTKLAMKYNITANLVNIVFNYLLIYGKFGFPRLEVRGAAIASVIGYTVACAMAIWAILGRARPDRARRASAACQKAGALISTLMGVLMFIFREPLVALFSSEAEILALGAGIMIFAALIQPFQSSFQIYAGALRGAGDSLFPAITLGIGILGIRPLFSSIFIQQFNMGLYGAWSALMIDQIFRFFIIQVRYRRGRWVSIKV
jgi:Na+-driven multidrug efflux pump